MYIARAMTSFGIWSLLPPVAALGLALWKKQIYPALLLGVWMGWWVVEGWNPIAATGSTVTSIVAVFLDAGKSSKSAISLEGFVPNTCLRGLFELS